MIRELEAEFRSRIYKALYFDGIDNYVDCGNDASLTFKNEFTIMTWVKPINTQHKGMGGVLRPDWRESIIIDRSWGLPASVKIVDYKGTLGVRIKRSYNNNIIEESFTTSFKVDETWQCIGFYVNINRKELGVFLNGDFEEFKLQYDLDKPLANSNSPWLIGMFPDESWVYVGYISEVRFYNKALSKSEIKHIYYNPSDPLDLNSLVLWLTPASIDVANGKWWDLSKYGNHGTIYGCAETYLVKPEVVVL